MIYILALVFAVAGAFSPVDSLRGHCLVTAAILYCTLLVLEKMEGR